MKISPGSRVLSSLLTWQLTHAPQQHEHNTSFPVSPYKYEKNLKYLNISLAKHIICSSPHGFAKNKQTTYHEFLNQSKIIILFLTSNHQPRILFSPIFSTNILIFFNCSNWEKSDDEEQQRIKLLFDLLRLFVKIRNSFFVKSWWAAS